MNGPVVAAEARLRAWRGGAGNGSQDGMQLCAVTLFLIVEGPRTCAACRLVAIGAPNLTCTGAVNGLGPR